MGRDRYASYLLKEFVDPLNYVVALVVGVVIHFAQGRMPWETWIPYVVPVVVQALSKSVVKYRGRRFKKLIQLPAEREDPTFIMDREGRILESVGKTREFFTEKGIDTLAKLFPAAPRVTPRELWAAQEAGTPMEFYCLAKPRYYRVMIQEKGDDWLVWLVDVSEYHRQDERLSGIRRFGREVVDGIDEIVRRDDIHTRLAGVILGDFWRGVLIAEEEDGGDLVGCLFQPPPSRPVPSEVLRIPRGADAPIWFSRKHPGRLVLMNRGSVSLIGDPGQGIELVADYGDPGQGIELVADYGDPESFYRDHPMGPRIREILGDPPPDNFVNFHEDNAVTVIAYGKPGRVGIADARMLEAVVDNAKVVRGLTDKVREIDAKFLQSVEGLCAAAEFSDEITGRHVTQVNAYAELLGKTLGLDDEVCVWLGQVSSLHDIGKVALQSLIKKPGKLEAAEMQEIRMHAVFGYQILRQMMKSQDVREPRLAFAARIALHHHQSWDGSGYPGTFDTKGYPDLFQSRDSTHFEKLRPPRGDETPEEAYIVSLADKYDALRGERQYKPEFSHRKTLGILEMDDRYHRSGADTFGPRVYEAFLDTHQRFAAIFDEMRD